MPHWHDLDFLFWNLQIVDNGTVSEGVRRSLTKGKEGGRESGDPKHNIYIVHDSFWKFRQVKIFSWMELLPVCTFRRPVWLTPPAKMSGSELGLTHTFRNLLTKPAELVSHDLWQKPHPCAFKILSFHKITSNTSVAFGQATSSGFLGSIALSCGQKPLSPFLAPLWATLQIWKFWRDSLPCKLRTIQMVHFEWRSSRFCCSSPTAWSSLKLRSVNISAKPDLICGN